MKVRECNFNICDEIESRDGYRTYRPLGIYRKDLIELFGDVEIVEIINEGYYGSKSYKQVLIDMSYEEMNDIIMQEFQRREKARVDVEVKKAKEYLANPTNKDWLQKMEYTIKEDEYGHKFVFLAILCGYKKITDDKFQELCNAVCWVNFGAELRMCMWIGGSVNWTMFYESPDHVNGSETYFCGVVARDNFSPEDFDRDHSEYSFNNAKDYIH